MNETVRKNKKQDIKGKIYDMLFWFQNQPYSKKNRILINYLSLLQSSGIQNLIDVTGILKDNKFTVPQIAEIIFKFDQYIMSLNKKYNPTNVRVVNKSSKNVKNIILTKFCIERKQEFIDFLYKYDGMPRDAVEQIKNAIEKEEKEDMKKNFFEIDLDLYQSTTFEENQNFDNYESDYFTNDFGEPIFNYF